MRELQITASITNRESRSMETYLQEIGRIGLITAEEEVALAQKIRQGDQAALERLTKANLRFVVSVAKKYQHLGLPLGDLVSEGNAGLVRAARHFDETRGFKFISYAVWWIRQSMLTAIAEHTRMIRLPMNHINLLTKINRVSTGLESRMERPPTDEEVAEFMETDPDKIGATRYYSGRTASYDALLGREEEYTLLDKLGNGEPHIGHLMEEACARASMVRLLGILSAREQQIIELSFGFIGERPLLPAEAGKRLGMSGERVRQIKEIALQKLAANKELIKARLF